MSHDGEIFELAGLWRISSLINHSPRTEEFATPCSIANKQDSLPKLHIIISIMQHVTDYD